MKRLLLFSIPVLFMLSCSKEIEADFSYTVSPVSHNGIPQLKVNLKCAADPDGETILLYQDKGWGQDSLHNVLASMRLLNAEATITKNSDSNWIEIKHPKGLETLDFEYILQQDTPDTLTTENTYRPIIQPEYFHVFSRKLFMLSEATTDKTKERFDVSISWEGFPENYAIQNSFGSGLRRQELLNTTEQEFHEAVFAGGDFRVHKLDINGNEVAFAIRGDWSVIDDKTIVDALGKTLQAQRDFYDDHSQPYYSVTLIPTFQEEGNSSIQGTGLTTSFALSATNNESLQTDRLIYVLNHELQHNWTGSLIKNDNEEEQYWFSEGFTEYYTLKNIASNNIINLDKSWFISEFNTLQKKLYTSVVRDEPNSEINEKNFWSSFEFSKLPYRRGTLFAFYLDYKITQDTAGQESLDDLLFQIKKDAETNGQKITHDYFIKTANTFLQEDIKPFFDTHIEQGKLMDLAKMYTEFGFEFDPTSKVYDLGFEFGEDHKNIISINETSAAYKAGLRQGDTFAGIDYSYSPTREAKFTVLRNGKEVPINFYPSKDAAIPRLRDNEANHNRLTF